MKLSPHWLRDWIDVPWNPRELGARLTMAGFEVEGFTPAAPEFSGVVVAEIVRAEPHPHAATLQVCEVKSGSDRLRQIVCGARNARVGLRTALAQVGAELPNRPAIAATSIRGIESEGMLCSAAELGFADGSDGILELPSDAPPGLSLRVQLDLDEPILELNITPNRGDAMSVLGIAREVAALSRRAIAGPNLSPVAPGFGATIEVRLEWPVACPVFAARVLRNLDNRRSSPLWLRERLRRAGVRSISPIVDVTNYVLLELGQPMHAYDRARLKGAIRARAAAAAESVVLLDGKEIALDADTLVIADDAGPVGLAGIMGGSRTAVDTTTTEVVLESAFFTPAAIAGRARRHGLQTDASQRFERGVDPEGVVRALERATALLIEIAGGEAGPVVSAVAHGWETARPAISLRRLQLERLLGIALPDGEVEARLRALGMRVHATPAGWSVVAPGYRFDIAIEADLIEEVARIGGYDAIPAVDASIPQSVRSRPEAVASERSVLEALAARDYREAITFAFVDPKIQGRLFPSLPALALANPISSDLAVMRVSLWPGLLRAALENERRQQDRVRLFERGVRFLVEGATTREVDTLAAVAFGSRAPQQWGSAPEPLDFFDVKSDLESLLSATGQAESFAFEAATTSPLYPGRSARIIHRDQAVGWIGELHPQLVAELGFSAPPIMFEIDYLALASLGQPAYESVSRYPQVRRDLALIVDEDVPLSTLRERVTFVTSSLLREFRVFDVYQGTGIEKGRKSVALGLIFQDNSRTLTDNETDGLVAAVVAELNASCNARLRE
jgi:phenylalanyl-tRNA synthetase beta chain